MTLFLQRLHLPAAVGADSMAAPESPAVAGAAVLLPEWVERAHPIKGLQVRLEMDMQGVVVVLRKPQHLQLVL
jgi:hypothetical protein